MANENDLVLKIQADSAKALKGIEALEKQLSSLDGTLKKTAKETEKIRKSTTDFGFSLVKIGSAITVATQAYNAFSNSISGTIGSFIKQDNAVNKVRNTLRLIGEKDIVTATKGFEDFASALQDNSTIGDEVSLNMIAVAKALRLTDDQAKNLVQTSAELAAVTGKDVQSSFDGLIETLKGQSGQVAKLAPELKNLTAEQLQQGKAVEILGEKFKGFAKAATQTVGGQLEQMKNLYGDVLEDIGKLFSDFFRLDDQRLAISALKAVQSSIKSIQPSVKELGDAFSQFFFKLKNGFANINISAKAATISVLTLGAALAAGELVDAFVELTNIAASLKKVAATAALAAAKFVLITGSILAISSATEIVIRNFDNMEDLGLIAINGLIIGFRKLGEFIVSLAKTIGKIFSELFKTIGEMFSKEMIKAFIRGEDVSDVIGSKLLASISKFGGQFTKSTEQLQSEIAKSSKKIDFGITGEAVGAIKDFMAGFGQQVDVTKKTQDQLNMSIADGGKNIIKNTKAIDDQKKILQEILQKNSEIGLSIESHGATQQEIIQLQLKNQLDLIEAKRTELKIQGMLSKEISSALDKQIELTKASASKASGSAPTQIQESLMIAGQQVGDEIVNSFAPVLGAVSGIGASVGAAQMVVDAVPNMLDGISNLITSIVELPTKIIDSLDKLFASILSFFGELPGKLVGMIDKIIKSAINFLIKLPQTIAKTFVELPKILFSLFDQLPDMIQDLVAALVESAPRIALSFIDFLVNGAPRIIGAIIAAIPKIAMALVDGIIEAFKTISNMLIDLISGKGSSLIDVDKTTNDIQKVMKKLSGSTSKLFAVTDLAEGAAQSKNLVKTIQIEGKKVVNAISKALDFTKALIFFTALFKAMEKAFEIAGELFDEAVEIAGELWDDAVKLAGEAWDAAVKFAGEAWDTIVNAVGEVWNEAVELAGEAWDTVVGLAGDAWNSAVSLAGEAWDTVVSTAGALWEETVGLAGDVWDKVVDTASSVWKSAVSVAGRIWDNVVDAASSAWDVVTSTASTVWQTITNFAGTAWELAVSTASTVWQTITSFASTAWELAVSTAGTAWSAVVTASGTIWNGIVATAGIVWNAAVTAAGTAWNTLLSIGTALWSAIVLATSTTAGILMTGGLSVLLAGVIAFFSSDSNLENTKKFFSELPGKLSEGFKSATDSLKKGFEGLTDFFKGAGGKIWDGLKQGMSGLGDLISKAFQLANPMNIMAKIFKIDSKETEVGKGGRAENILRINLPFVQFASGGMVPGQAKVQGDSELNDRIVALLSPGEAVISREMMDNPLIKKMVDLILSGNLSVPKFAIGGFIGQVMRGEAKLEINPDQVVKDLKNGVAVAQEVLESLDPSQLWDIVKDKLNDSILKIFQANRFASGGLVGDTIPAMLTPGEFVMSRAGVANAGVGNLAAINSGRGNGQVVNNYHFQMPLTIDNRGVSIDATFVRQRILPTIEQELKRASIEGRFVISQKGIRNA